jgi:hypothetical protein
MPSLPRNPIAGSLILMIAVLMLLVISQGHQSDFVPLPTGPLPPMVIP